MNLEQKLTQYKTEKHELFHTLKKVLHDDETRRRAKEAPHPNLYLQPAVRPQGGIYMKPHPQVLITSQQPPQQAVKRQRSPSPPRSGIPAAYFRNPVGGPSGSKYPVTTAYSAAPSAHSAHYTSYPGSAVVSVGNNHLEHEEAARAKHIYLAPAAQQARFAERERASHPARSLAPPPAAHSSVTPVYRSGGSSGSIMTGYPRYNLPSGSAAITTAGAIAGSPRLTHSQANGTGPPTQRYYTSRD